MENEKDGLTPLTQEEAVVFMKVKEKLTLLRDGKDHESPVSGICDILDDVPDVEDYLVCKLKLMQYYRWIYGEYVTNPREYWSFGRKDLSRVANSRPPGRDFDFYNWYDLRIRFLERWINDSVKYF
jgi:hypothetical protein